MIISVIAAALPLLFGIKNFESALLLTSSVILSVFFFELVFLISCKFRAPIKSALSGFTISSCVLIAISLTGDLLWSDVWHETAPFFPLAFAGAFSLIRITAMGTAPLVSRSRIWAGFVLPVLVFGLWSEAGAQTFPGGPLWLSGFVGLVLAQIIFYNIRLKQSIKLCWVLGGIYLVLFLITRGLLGFLPPSLAQGMPLLVFALLFVFDGFLKRGPTGGTVVYDDRPMGGTDFYLYSGIWVGVIQLSSPAEVGWINGTLVSLLAAFLLPLLAAINERLELLDIPEKFAGLPAFLISGGILLLGLFGLLHGAF